MPHRSMGGWQVHVAGHIVGAAGEAGGWGGEKWLDGAGGDGWGRWRVGGEEWRGGGGYYCTPTEFQN